MTHVNCPKCGERLNLPPIQEKRGVRCPACKHEFAVSPPSQPPPLPGDYTGEDMGVIAKTSKRNKYVGLLVLGIGMTILIHGVDLSRLIIYFVVLSIIAVIVAAARRDVRKFWFPALAWLFLAAGIVDIVGIGLVSLTLRPHAERAHLGDRGGLLIHLIVAKLEEYRLDVGHYPSEDEGGLSALVTAPTFKGKTKAGKWAGPYMNRKQLKDPWGNELGYELVDEEQGDTSRQVIHLWSHGPNGVDEMSRGASN